MTDTHHTTDCSSVIGRKRPRSDEEKAATSSSSSSSSSLSSLSSESSWKTMYENEHTKNTMLNLQLCFVQSECMRLLNLQNDMANSIATLQNSLASWIQDIGSDDNESGSEEDSTDGSDNHTSPVTSDDMSGSGTDEEDQGPLMPRNLIIIHKHPRVNPCTTIIQ